MYYKCHNCGQKIVRDDESPWTHQASGFIQCIDGQGFARASEVPGQVSLLEGGDE